MVINVKMVMDPLPTIEENHGIDKNGPFEKYLRDTVDRLCDPYIPRRSGSLSREKAYPNNYTIKYTSPYAHYMYKGKVYISPKLGVSGILLKNGRWWSPKGETKIETNRDLIYNGAPKRGANWLERMLADRGSEIERDLQDFIKRGKKNG